MTVDYIYIDEDISFNEYCKKLHDCDYIGIDTEFISEKSFSPLLCLIIIHSSLGTVIIDPFKISNFEPLKAILVDENVTKITHAGENDYKIFYNDFNVIPVNVFDTQIAAGIVYADYPISLEKLIYRELKVSLPKSSTVSDWSQRPLSKKQLDYAVFDVYYLIKAMNKLKTKLEKVNKLNWLDSVQENYFSEAKFSPSFEFTISKLRFSHSPKINELVWLYRAMKWREQEAKSKDYNKSRIFKNKEIKDIFRLSKEGPNAWKKHRQFKYAKQINWSKLYEFGTNKPLDSELETIKEIKSHHVTFHKNESKELMTDILYTSLKYLLHDTISMTLVLNKDLIRKLVYNVGDSKLLLPDWKRNILGEEASSLLLNAHNRKLQISTDGIKFV